MSDETTLPVSANDETLPASAWDKAIPQRLLDMPYDEEYAFTQAKHYMSAAFDNLSHAGEYFLLIQKQDVKEFPSKIEAYGYDRNSVGLALSVIYKKSGIATQKSPADCSSRMNISMPNQKQLGLFMGPMPEYQDVIPQRELARHLNRVQKEKDRIETELVTERTLRDQTERELADRIDRERNWTPDNADEQHLKDLLEKCLSRAVAIRNILTGIRLKDVTPIQLGFITDYLENMESQVRAGAARVKLQFGLLDPDTVSFFEGDADSHTAIDPPAVTPKPPAEENDKEPPEDKPDGSSPAIIKNFNPR